MLIEMRMRSMDVLSVTNKLVVSFVFGKTATEERKSFSVGCRGSVVLTALKSVCEEDAMNEGRYRKWNQ